MADGVDGAAGSMGVAAAEEGTVDLRRWGTALPVL